MGGCGVLLALLVPASAPASKSFAGQGYEIQRPRTTASAYLGRSHGYEIGLSSGDPGIALLYVQKFPDTERFAVDEEGFTSTAYAVRTDARLSNGVIRARFGGLGRVSLRFKPNGHTRLGHNRGCSGRRPITESGSFHGTVSLRGEGGYFRSSVTTARAVLERSFRLRCKRGEAANPDPATPLREYVEPGFTATFGSGGGAIALLYAVAKIEGRSIGIRASHQQGSPPGAEVQLGTLESEHGMAVGRTALVNGGPGTLLTSLPGEHPASATLAPPFPFSGEGSLYESSSRSHSWTGSLSVSLPGLEQPLTGPRFSTSLCVLSPLKSPSGCDFTKPKPLLPAMLRDLSNWMHR